jgi:hypothetical protein
MTTPTTVASTLKFRRSTPKKDAPLETAGATWSFNETRMRSLTHSRSGRSGEVWPFDLDANVSLRGIGHAMKREREIRRERDELNSLAPEAGQSALLGMTALILVMALVLGFAV